MNTILPFVAAYYSQRNRARIASLAVPDLDSVEHLWGKADSSLAFRNVLVGAPEQRGEVWHAWMASGEVELADAPAFYILHQQFPFEGRKVSRWAILAALELDSKQIFIHEDVLGEGVERARQSTEACEGDMAPIFVGCAEDLGSPLRSYLQKTVSGRPALLEYSETAGSVHKIWRIDDPTFSLTIQEMFQERELFLLDGHHRLAAARENFRLGIGDGKILASICSMETEDTLILPIHRAVFCERWILRDSLLEDLARAGCHVSETQIRPQDIERELAQVANGELSAFALYAHSDRVFVMQLPKVDSLPPSLAALPVAILDFCVLKPQKAITVIPVPDFRLTLDQLALDQAQVAFFLPSVSPGQVRAVAKAGLKMPRKSTRFIPKPALGLICRPWSRQD